MAIQGGNIPEAVAEPFSQDVVLNGDTGILQGTLLRPPAAAFSRTAVLIVAGSGPVDRNGNLPTARNDSLKQLADAMAAAGVISLRFDKRGIGASAAAGPDESELRIETFIQDTKDWLDLLRSDATIDRVFILGHSEGALIATLAAQSRSVNGIILLAGAGSPADIVILRQLSAGGMADSSLAQVQDVLAHIKAGEEVVDIPTAWFPLFRPSVLPYLRSWLAYDPALELARVTAPILVLQGSTDLQMTREDAERLAATHSGLKPIHIAGMNHVLKSASTDVAANVATYNSPDLPLHPDLAPAVLRFIKSVP